VIVDCHTHYVPRDLVARLSAPGEDAYGYAWAHEGSSIRHPAGPALPVGYAELHDPQAKLACLDERGVDAALVSITPHLFVYDHADRLAFARRANDDLAAFAAASPRLFGLGTVALADPAAAAAELERGVRELGFRGAILGTSLPDGAPLSRAVLDPLFEVAQALGAPLMLHPYYAGPVRTQELFLANTVGVPLDTALAALHVTLSGALDRWPGVRLVLVHGGGSLPYTLGRADNAWRMKEAARGAAQRPPGEYLDRFLFDTVLHLPAALRYLAGLAGEDALLLGTDSPYLTGERDPCAFVRRAGLDPERLGATAVEAFSLDA
jgi:aminocarboxymuconate-semialdehyde decarboxylase